MIREALSKDDDDGTDASLAFKPMLLMAIATSIDALAVGVTFSFDLTWVEMLMAVSIIAVITFILSALAVKLGAFLGCRFGNWAERAGGIVLVLMGVKILLEGLGIL